MKKTRYTGEQIAFALKQAETDNRVGEVCPKMDISEASFTIGKRNSPIWAFRNCSVCGN